MWLNICILALCAVYSAQTVQIEPLKSVFTQAEGSTLQVNCTSPNSQEWSANPSSAMPAGAVHGQAASGDNISTLMLENIQKSNEGIFRCTDKAGQDMTFELKVFSVTTKNATFQYKENAVLECSVMGDPTKEYTYSWMKGDTLIEKIPVEGKEGYVEHENGTLEIIQPSRSFAGVYTCMAKYLDGSEYHTIDIDVPYTATPFVLPFDKSKNLVQEETLVVECRVLGYPKPYITWMKGDTVILGGKESPYTLLTADTYDGMPIANGRLEIKEVGFDDAAQYKCMARNDQWPNFNSTQTILVRVKDKLAALWPFLGIVAEVVILCIIIFIYEKKRNKDAMMDEEEDQDGATPEKTSENVRHRGSTNNPRA